jgi:hydrogenase maturation protein HypF
MAENKIETKVIGVAFDGTGYGTDGTVWGGEYLLADYKGFRRLGYLEPVPMPGGAAAIRKPYRMALGYLYTLLGDETDLEGLPLARYRSGEFDLLKTQLSRNVNTPLTSSAGRLFDAVSALLGVCGEITYSAQAAIELEMLAADADTYPGFYPFTITLREGVRTVRLAELFSAVIKDIRQGVPVPQISRRFHNTVAMMIVEMCRLIAGETRVTDIALSGGVFQNRLLHRLAVAALEDKGYRVITHHLVPCNDGGIALGQAVVASFAEE